jgi:hypothetical protein
VIPLQPGSSFEQHLPRDRAARMLGLKNKGFCHLRDRVRWGHFVAIPIGSGDEPL